MKIDLSGRVALVTGASRGIGRAIAIAMARAGAAVAVNYKAKQDLAEEVLREIEGLGAKGASFRADVSEASQVGAMLE